MNQQHLDLLSSEEWAGYVREDLLPRALEGVELGDHLLEVGPGPGKTTDELRQQVDRLTAVEIDPTLAAALAERLAGTNVEVVEADATRLPFDDATFSAASSFTMLHHVPTPELQDRLLAEVARVLRPGGVFVGADSVDSEEMQAFHVDDVLVPIDPETFADRLRRAGFAEVEIETAAEDYLVRRSPAVGPDLHAGRRRDRSLARRGDEVRVLRERAPRLDAAPAAASRRAGRRSRRPRARPAARAPRRRSRRCRRCEAPRSGRP